MSSYNINALVRLAETSGKYTMSSDLLRCRSIATRCLPAHTRPKHSVQAAVLVERKQEGRLEERCPVLQR
uniref:Uncharacterized protein n=1 Tax=Anguilla anguilla TaxID=7936 RepID=A0A0E9RFZ6_ANGAN